MGRCGEISEDMGIYGEIWGDMGDMGRYAARLHSSMNAGSSIGAFLFQGRSASGADGAGKPETASCCGSGTPFSQSSLRNS